MSHAAPSGFTMRALTFLFIMLAIFPAAVSQTATPPFSIAIGSPREVWKLGADVRVDVAIRNDSDKQIVFVTCRGEGLEGVFTHIEVRDENGRLVPAPLKSLAASLIECSGPGSAVRPGETMTYGFTLGKLVEIKQPGNYTIQVQRHASTTRPQKSNELTITVSD